jgi:hypothetical protein
MPGLCPNCLRPVGLSLWLVEWVDGMLRNCCTRECFDQMSEITKSGRSLTQLELEAVQAALPDVGKIVAEIGMDKPFQDWEREEVMRLVFKAYRAVNDRLGAMLGHIPENEIPY